MRELIFIDRYGFELFIGLYAKPAVSRWHECGFVWRRLIVQWAFTKPETGAEREARLTALHARLEREAVEREAMWAQREAEEVATTVEWSREFGQPLPQ